MANLLQNAVDFSPEGGRILVTLTGDAQSIKVRVTDEGPGIPDYALDRVCDPFYSLQRPDSGEKSSGLGLTFVRNVAELHGGHVSVENGPRGGAVATLTLRTVPPAMQA
jgi:two-component system sensor histidine kinase CreC